MDICLCHFYKQGVKLDKTILKYTTGSYVAAAHGVTLTAANTVVWWGPTSSLETYAQANARVHRSGQQHKCTVIQLQGSYVEKRMYGLLDKRIDVHTKMIDLYKEMLD